MAVTTLYRMLDEGGHLLYVGIAGNPGRRAEDHGKDKAWWPNVALMVLEHYPSRPQAEAAERLAIATERPLYNVTYQTGKAQASAVPRRLVETVLEAFGIRRWVPRVLVEPPRTPICRGCGRKRRKTDVGFRSGLCPECWFDERQALKEARRPPGSKWGVPYTSVYGGAGNGLPSK